MAESQLACDSRMDRATLIHVEQVSSQGWSQSPTGGQAVLSKDHHSSWRRTSPVRLQVLSLCTERGPGLLVLEATVSVQH